jgi:hypothetical protein
MLAFMIALTWLALTAGGFAALTALGRRERRQDLSTDRGAFLESERSALAYTSWPGPSGASAR